MGIPMDDIHAPTVTSGPTSDPRSADEKYSQKLSLLELISERDKVEAELKALGSVLDSHGVTMSTSLTTFDGYPRDDIDVAQIATTRQRIIRMKNDYKALMARIETGLHAHHAALQAEASQATTQPTPLYSNSHSPAESQPTTLEAPFAKVNSVVDGSPADEAGLKAGDAIRRFGHVNWINHQNLGKVAEVVGRNEGHPILVKISRRNEDQTEELQMQLIPRRNWGGRGLLGCHLLPL